VIDIVVAPRSARERVGPAVGDRLRVAVNAPPVDGKANEAVVRVLAEAFGVPRSAVAILRGETGKRKTVKIAGATAARLAQVLGLAMMCLIGACNSPGSASRPPAPAAQKPAARTYGAALAPAQAITVGALLARPASFEGRTVTVDALVRKACTRKGCWMELADDAATTTPGCRVTFKDYGFFVPTDSAGARARVQGTIEIDTLSAAKVRHYEEEGAVFPAKKPDGTAPEVRIVATGVELRR
jgi:uncharacterized protein (TIGR00251 family)